MKTRGELESHLFLGVVKMSVYPLAWQYPGVNLPSRHSRLVNRYNLHRGHIDSIRTVEFSNQLACESHCDGIMKQARRARKSRSDQVEDEKALYSTIHQTHMKQRVVTPSEFRKRKRLKLTYTVARPLIRLSHQERDGII